MDERGRAPDFALRPVAIQGSVGVLMALIAVMPAATAAAGFAAATALTLHGMIIVHVLSVEARLPRVSTVRSFGCAATDRSFLASC